MFKNIIGLLVLNFIALAIGGIFTGDGVSSEWYQTIEKAPWTPPGWVFGFAWTLIMVCFGFYMGFLLQKVQSISVPITLFGLQWILNVAWNPLFFYFHWDVLGLITIVILLLIVLFFLFRYHSKMRASTLLIMPYALWLLIATSLNAYIVFMN